MPAPVALALAGLVAVARAQAPTAPPQTAARAVSLDGAWQIRPESDPDGWRPVQVPAAFETALGEDFDGVARYRLHLPLTAASRVASARVEFAAVATHARVVCNGVEVGEHLGGWTPFRVELTEALRWDGHDVLEVVVDERVGHNTQGFLPVIQPHFGGIWQGVTLRLDDGPVLDRLVFSAHATADGLCECSARVLGGAGRRLHVEVRVGDDDPSLGALLPVGPDGSVHGTAAMPELEPWAPGRPVLHALRLRLLDGERELDRVERRVGFRHLRASGTRVLWNAAPFQMRGVLHWGYSPPHLAPPVDPAWWRPQLEYFRALGFNTLKCCLWVPPRCVYELCDELGLAVWQEYPAWHPNMDQAHREELLREYAEFFALDAGHVSVGFRSITCETGHGADLDVVRALFELCKATVPHSLVVDDSSWIGWQRVTDFWDEHPYGNNQWFVERLEHFRRHIREHGEKPLLLGECMAADTWVDRAAWRTRHGDEARWWRPLCWDAQADAEPWLVREFGEETLASLQPTALAFGMENRRFQIEQLRLGMPDAGYVVSVARDFAKARMGLYDDLDRPKWSAADWAWHGDTMICLAADARDRVADLHHPVARLVVSHYGHGALRGELVVRGGAGDELHRTAVALAPGRNSAPIEVPLPRDPRGFGFSELRAELTGSHPAQNTWRLPSLPDWHLPGVTTRAALDKETLARLLAGERVLLTTGAPDAPGAVRSQALWWLRGAPFAPPHPLYRQVPADVLTHLMAFALESGRVIPWQPWRDEVDPILAFWETHDTDAVRFHLLAFETRVGEGRLLVTSLDLGERAPSYAQALLAFVLARHLESGPPPARALSDATIAALEAHFDARTIELPTWRFRTDPDDVGRERGWSEPATDVTTAAWRDLRAGSHWENQADDLKHYTGVAWYRVDLDVPADWSDVDARLVFDGVDDSFDVWLDGEHLGAFGDPATGTTVWLEQQVQELGRRLRPGSRHALVLRVVDHQGAGGLWRPVRVTTGPVGRMAELLR